jgi:RNA polymerase sigma factor (sigma-70 family)
MNTYKLSRNSSRDSIIAFQYQLQLRKLKLQKTQTPKKLTRDIQPSKKFILSYLNNSTQVFNEKQMNLISTFKENLKRERNFEFKLIREFIYTTTLAELRNNSLAKENIYLISEDLTQEILIKLLKRMKQKNAEPIQLFSAYIRKSIKNSIIDYARKMAGSPKQISLDITGADSPSLAETTPSEEPSPMDRLMSNEAFVFLSKVIQDLRAANSPPFNTFLQYSEAHYGGYDLKYEDLVSKNLPLGTVKSRIARGRQRLCQAIIERNREMEFLVHGLQSTTQRNKTNKLVLTQQEITARINQFKGNFSFVDDNFMKHFWYTLQNPDVKRKQCLEFCLNRTDISESEVTKYTSELNRFKLKIFGTTHIELKESQ